MTLTLIKGDGAFTARQPGRALRGMTALECGRTRLTQMIGQRLTARGMPVSYPGDGPVTLAVSGTEMRADLTVHERYLLLECEPFPDLEGPGRLAGHLCAAAAAILSSPRNARPDSNQGSQAPLIEIAGPALRAAGLSAAMDVYADHETFDVVVTLALANKALPNLGKVTIADDGALTWDWPYPCASGAASVADKAASALRSLITVPQPARIHPSWK